MIESSPIWVVTDVDGTLMDHAYDLTPAKETIKFLQGLSIPIILCTSKTAAEVEVIRNQLSLNDPYIVENGAAIYGENLRKFNGKIILGEKYEVLEVILKTISNQINYDLIPLNNLSDEDATELTGLRGIALTLMRDRHWSMPFLNPPDYLEKILHETCIKHEVVFFRGNRMSHLLSKSSDKGKAILKLKHATKNLNVKVIGLGDSPNDLPLLLNSDYRIVIPGEKGPNIKLLDKLKNVEYVLAKEPNGYGWKSEINKYIKNFFLDR